MHKIHNFGLYIDGCRLGFLDLKSDSLKCVMQNLQSQAIKMKNNFGIEVVLDEGLISRLYSRNSSRADEFLLIPDWKCLATTYLEAIHKVIKIFEERQAGKVLISNLLDILDSIQQTPESIKWWENLAQKQRGNAFVVPVQMSDPYLNCSPSYACNTITKFGGCGFGVFSSIVAFLNNPQLKYDIHCIGDTLTNERSLYVGKNGVGDTRQLWLGNIKNIFGTGIMW